jgi:hypothetical protein
MKESGVGWGDQILLLLLGSYQGQGHYPTQRSAKICEKRKMPQRKKIKKSRRSFGKWEIPRDTSVKQNALQFLRSQI